MKVSRLENLDLVQGILPGRFSGPAGGQDQAGTVVGPTQLGGHQQDTMAQGLQRGVLKVQGQAEPLEPIDEVVGEQEKMKVGLVGEEVASGDAAQGVIPFELFDEQLDPGAVLGPADDDEAIGMGPPRGLEELPRPVDLGGLRAVLRQKQRRPGAVTRPSY